MAKITNIEMGTTSTGKPFKKATLDEQIMGKDRFNTFTFHTRYDDVVVGRDFAPEEFEKDGEYIKLKDPNKGIKTGLGGRKTFDASVVMERKNENIRESQERKNDSIKISSTARDASMILVALMSRGDVSGQDWQSKWVEIRKWLLEHFDDVESIEPIFQ